mmetsp:Transcript_32847/g.70440  ORF Transcript_32847/g.70440 Transcript_32847/m.70440 type:complete len:350 (-) Transcript_32847:1422-2471(-)
MGNRSASQQLSCPPGLEPILQQAKERDNIVDPYLFFGHPHPLETRPRLARWAQGIGVGWFALDGVTGRRQGYGPGIALCDLKLAQEFLNKYDGSVHWLAKGKANANAPPGTPGHLETLLLSRAMTTSSGSVWQRQRTALAPCLKKGQRQIQQRQREGKPMLTSKHGGGGFGDHTFHEMVSLVSSTPDGSDYDIKTVIKRMAARGICELVLGDAEVSKEVIDFYNVVRLTRTEVTESTRLLAAARGEELRNAVSRRLDEALERARKTGSSPAARAKSPSLLELCMETIDVNDPEGENLGSNKLCREEILCNLHSFLMGPSPWPKDLKLPSTRKIQEQRQSRKSATGRGPD